MTSSTTTVMIKPSPGTSKHIEMLAKNARNGPYQAIHDYELDTLHSLGNQVRMHAAPRK
jgi:hypothetical protein